MLSANGLSREDAKRRFRRKQDSGRRIEAAPGFIERKGGPRAMKERDCSERVSVGSLGERGDY